MKIVMTLMVRDEVDILRAMLDHHLAEGVDFFIVTDNGSFDGTTEVLREYQDRGVLELRSDPIHRKQQAPTVTAMARDAYSIYGADWVLNADADEFWVARDPSITLRFALENIPREIGSFPVPVVDMIGPPALEGSGLSRLVYRDERPVDELYRLGLLAHSTADVAHIGSPSVSVVQGNHFVDIPSTGLPATAFELEVLHLPWRSWKQYSHKVRNAGRAYEANPELTPSPNHHGMRDYRRLLAGSLFGWYLLRHPTDAQIAEGIAAGSLVEDRRLTGLRAPIADIAITDDSAQPQRELAADAGRAIADLRLSEQREIELRDQLLGAWHRTDAAEAELSETKAALQAAKNRRVVRLADVVINFFSRGRQK